ncbi:MAG: Trk system potassium transporter TrkA [Clostridia bacterium]|nr:Trk system potassium transporter TrkA [Clostridia bacterium]
MNIVIVGVGKVGKTLALSFISEGHDVVVIDQKRSAVEALVNGYDVKGIVGVGLERQALSDASVDVADLFIACTSRDEMNILTCVLAKKMGAKRCIARVRETEYFKEIETLRQDMGLDLLFNPERRTAFEIENELKFPSSTRLEVFAGGKALMVEFEIEKSNPIVGKSLIEINKEYGIEVLFGTVERQDSIKIPNGSFEINAGDLVRIIGSEKNITAFCKKTKMFKRRAKSVVIVGGGKIAVNLANELLKSDISVKIIEIDRDKCQKLAEALPRATIICGDGTDQTLLNEEKIMDADACVTLTDYDERNIMISLYAMQKNVSKVITKINRTSVLQMAEFIGLTTVVSPREAIANQIVAYVRATMDDKDRGVNNFYKLGEGIEAVEFEVGESFESANVPLKNLKIKPATLIGGIVREDKFILPNGDTQIKQGDKVIVVTANGQMKELSEIFR